MTMTFMTGILCRTVGSRRVRHGSGTDPVRPSIAAVLSWRWVILAEAASHRLGGAEHLRTLTRSRLL